MMEPNLPDLPRAAQILDQADAAYDQARYPAAGELYREVLALEEPGTVRAARCRLGLGRVLNTQSRFDEAREYVEAALPFLVDDPPHCALAQYVLGEIIANQGDLVEAAHHFQYSYHLRKDWFGRFHPAALDSLSMMAVLEFVQGHTDQASDLIGRAVEAARSYRGDPHPAIGRVYQRQGRILTDDQLAFGQAREMLVRALAIFEASEGPDHPDNGLALNNLANLLARRKLWGEARDLLLRSLEIHERVFGPQSAFVIMVLNNLSDVEQHLDNLEPAYHYAARALIASVRSLGARSPQSLGALRRLVSVLGKQSHGVDSPAMQIAMPFHVCLVALEAAGGKRDRQAGFQPGAHLSPERAAERLEKLVDRLEKQVNRPPRSAEEQAAEQLALSQARGLVELGDEALKAGKADRACELYSQALENQQAVLGPDHLGHLPVLQKLAEASEAAGRPSAVLPLRERAVAICTAVLGEDHPQTLLAMTHLYERVRYEYGDQAALPLQKRIREVMEHSLGSDDPMVRSLNSQLEQAQARGETSGREERPRDGLSRSERIEAAARSLRDPAGLLAGLDQVDWHAVSHAYGPADDIPRLLRLLLSEDPDVYETAWDELINDVWHQGTLYPATAAVAPFLIQLLSDPRFLTRVQVMDVLAGWAGSSAYQAVYARPGSLLVERDEIEARKARGEIDSSLLREEVEQVNRAVARGLPRYLELLDGSDREMQLLALFTLSRLRDRQAECIPEILARLPGFSEPSLRAAALCALRAIMDAGAESTAFFTRWMLAPGEDAQVTFHAAAGVIEREQERSSDEAAGALLASWPLAVESANKEWKQRQSQFGVFYQVSVDDLKVLAGLGVERGSRFLVQSLLQARPPLADAYQVLSLAEVMLDLLFKRGNRQAGYVQFRSDLIEGQRQPSILYKPADVPPLHLADLTPLQIDALKALAALPEFWRTRSNLLALYGLPDTLQGLTEFLVE